MTFNEEDAPAIGRAIYHEKIRPTLGPEHKGKIVVIDVKSGDYEIADGPLKGRLQAVRKLHERRPDAYTWDEWVDVPVTYKMHPSIKPLSPAGIRKSLSTTERLRSGTASLTR